MPVSIAELISKTIKLVITPNGEVQLVENITDPVTAPAVQKRSGQHLETEVSCA